MSLRTLDNKGIPMSCCASRKIITAWLAVFFAFIAENKRLGMAKKKGARGAPSLFGYRALVGPCIGPGGPIMRPRKRPGP